MESTHSRAQLAAQLIAGTLTLRQPFSAQLEVTPYLGTAVLGKLNPLLTTAISSESPIHVRIAKDEFALPLSPWNPTGIRMQSGRLNLGKIALRNEGMVLRLLNLLNSSAAQEPILYAWFTPLPASILEGTMRLDRMDALLASRLHIATWGRYAIPTQRVDLNVAIAGESLRKILDEPTIQDDDYLVIPMYGPAGHLSIDWLQAGAQLTALKAQAKGGKKALFGTVLDIVSGSSKKRAQIPPPPPLPWQ